MKKLIYLLLISSTLSCARLELVAEPSRSISAVPKEKPCLEIMNDFMSVTKSGYAAINYRSISYKRNTFLENLKDYYKKVDSTLDYLNAKELPIHDMVKIVNDPQEGLLAKVMMIRQAKYSIDMTYFLFDTSNASKTILHELRLAAKRGVKIRILYDPVGSQLAELKRAASPTDLISLAALSGKEIIDQAGMPTGKYANIEIVKFNPIWDIKGFFKNWMVKVRNVFLSKDSQVSADNLSWNNRIHDKILMIDAESPKDTILISGGRNLSSDYFHLSDMKTPTTDVEYIIRGGSKATQTGNIENPFLDQYNRIFYAIANHNLTNYVKKINREIAREQFKDLRKAHGEVLGSKIKSSEGELTKKLETMVNNNYLDSDFENSTIEFLHEIQNLSQVSNYFKPSLFFKKLKSNPNTITEKVFKEFFKAKSKIDIISPYFWISDEEISQLIKWLADDPSRSANIVSNSFVSTDNLISQTVVEHAYSRLEKAAIAAGVDKQLHLKNFGKKDDSMFTPEGINYGFLHAKVYMIDEEKIILSTSNLDPISRDINSEMGVAIRFEEKKSKNLNEIKKFVNEVNSRSTLRHSPEDKEMWEHPIVKARVQRFNIIYNIVLKLNLIPIL